MRTFIVKVRSAVGTERVIDIRATGRHEAARKALWYELPGAEALWVEPASPADINRLNAEAGK